MNVSNGRPRILSVGNELPPMEPDAPTPPKRKANRQKTGNRFAVLNAFVDAIAGELNRSEVLVWLVLFRDTRD